MKYMIFILLLVLSVSCSKSTVDPELPDVEKPVPQPETDEFVPLKGCVVLDIVQRSGELENSSDTGRNLYSAEYIMDVAGVPYSVASSLQEAMDKGVIILLSSGVKATTFTEEEWGKLQDWVKEGGILVAPALIDVPMGAAAVFGISSSSYNKLRISFHWSDNHLADKELEYMDQPEEQTIALGNSSGKEGETSVKTYGYSVGTAETLASFNTGETAVSRNAVGSGYAYTFGFLWRDVIQRSQLNKDFSASRAYSNAFEPSADIYSLFIRSLYAKANDVTVWKFTVPGGYESVLIPTHDCDSKTAYDEMHWISEYEKQLGMKAHFFLTAHFYRDTSYLSAFYDNSAIVNSKKLIANGHTVGSHSIGHFPDFNKTERFPLTVVAKDEYRPHHDVVTGITAGGSTWAETALSKQILEADLGTKVRSFRSGHLCMNKNIPLALRNSGFEFSSCYSAGDLLSSFPFFERIGNEWAGELSSVLQIPLHFSDVISSDPMNEQNWMKKPAMWLEVLNKLKGNYAPSVLLIHPNREWKMLAQKMLVESMDRNAVGLYNFEDYGDFWVERNSIDFQYSYNEDKKKLAIQVNSLNLNAKAYAFGLDCKGTAVPANVILMDRSKNSIPLKVKQISAGRFIAYL